MKVEELEPVDYLKYFEDPIRITHETDALRHVKEFLDPGPEVNDKKYSCEVRKEIKKRKQVMAAMDQEIKELEELIQ